MKRPLPTLTTDAEAEIFVNEADLELARRRLKAVE